jgi:WD40 repeat protein
MGEILDCIEITKPMLIITACMDSKIRLININEKSVVQTWNQHSLGVRSLNFNPYMENNGYILSVGFEYFINLYCTDISLEESYRGKLEGHYAPVISCKFIANSYMAVSVDEEANVRIWDTRLKLCLQLIAPPKKKIKINNILGMFKYNKFMIYGNKIIYYDAKYKEEDVIEVNQIKEDDYPIKVEYNYYYQQFFVATFKDIRVYSKDGEIYKDFDGNDENPLTITITGDATYKAIFRVAKAGKITAVPDDPLHGNVTGGSVSWCLVSLTCVGGR